MPDHVEQVSFDDLQGHTQTLLLPYWKTREDQDAWLARSDWQELIATPLTGDIGLYAECFSAPTRRLDGNYAIANVEYGIGRHSEIKQEQFHGYMGSMRDRVPGFLSGESDGTPGQLREPAKDRETLGKALQSTGLPDNLCYIRSGFAWKDASPEEQEVFMRDMYVVYQEGAQYLSENPTEANCISMRRTDAIQRDFDSGVQSSSISWFLTLKDLERWVRSHPRHLAIMRTIMGYMEKFNFQPKLNLGHEVVVVPEGQITAQYNNCTPDTGFLPFFDVKPIVIST